MPLFPLQLAYSAIIVAAPKRADPLTENYLIALIEKRESIILTIISTELLR